MGSVGNRFSAEWVLGAVSWLKSGAGRPVRAELLPASRAR